MKSCLILMTFLFFNVAHSEDYPTVNDKKYGDIEFGSKLLTVAKKLPYQADTPDENCKYVTFKKYPAAKFMVEEGNITRVDIISKAGFKNSIGLDDGISINEIKKRFPNAVITPHKYDPTGNYVIFKSSDKKRAVVFEASSEKIDTVRAGLEPAVEYVEGCL